MSASKKSPKVVISGYYGFDNAGDEAVLLSIIHCLKKLSSDVQITVLSGNPERTRKLYGVDAVNRWNVISIKLRLLGADLLISGGGSLIQDVTSARSSLYYLGVIRLAHILRIKVMIYSQGVGPLIYFKNKKATAKAFNRCAAITVRDTGSAALLKEIGVTRDVAVTCDPVLALGRDNASIGVMSELLLEIGVSKKDSTKGKPLLFVSVRFWKDDKHIEPIAKILDAQMAKGWDILLVPAHFPEDLDACEAIKHKMTVMPFIIERCMEAREFLALAVLADRVFSMRLHGLICAMAVGTPFIGLSYDPKVDAFMSQTSMENYCLSYDDADLAETGIKMFDSLAVFDEVQRRRSSEQSDEGTGVTAPAAPACENVSPSSPESPSPATLFEMHRRELSKLAWDTAKKAVSLLK